MSHDLPPDPLAEERDPPHALPRGTLLNDKFRLQRVIGVGGFGIVYLAHDEMSDVNVAIKEYMPTSLAGRTKTMQVSLTSQSNAETFALGLKSFWNEARLLAKFRDEHLPLLKVYDAFQANGTAYMVMPVLRGRTAYQVRRDMPKPPSERWLRTLMIDLLPALERLHAENVYHRDIAPDNIQIDIHAKPVLMDLGAARHVISNRTQSITAILKPGYAPIEQYGENDKLRQGPWTDIYALGATLYFLLLNKAPSSATSRMFDTGVPLVEQELPGCSPAFLRVIDWMLAVRPEDRPQNVAQLRSALDDSDPTTRIMAPKATPPAAARAGAVAAATPAAPAAPTPPTTQMAPPAIAMARAPAPKVAAPPAAATVTATMLPTEASPRTPAPQTPAAAPPSARAAIFGQPAHAAAPAGSDRAPMPMLLAGAAALVLVVGAAVWLWPSETTPAAASARPNTGSAPAAAQAIPAAPAVEPRRAEPVVLPATATVASPTTPPVGAAGPVVAPALPPKLEPAAPQPAAPPAPAPAPTAVVKADEASTTTAAAVSGKRASAPAATPAAGKKAALVNDKDGALLPKPQEPAPVAVAPAPPPPPPSPAPVPTPVAAPAAPTIASPSDRCSNKDGFARTLCVSLVCGVPELHNHPECVAIRRR